MRRLGWVCLLTFLTTGCAATTDDLGAARELIISWDTGVEVWASPAADPRTYAVQEIAALAAADTLSKGGCPGFSDDVEVPVTEIGCGLAATGCAADAFVVTSYSERCGCFCVGGTTSIEPEAALGTVFGPDRGWFPVLPGR